MLSEIFSALQVALARLGIIAHDQPTEFGAPFGIYLETKLRRMKKHYSISGRIQYIKRQIAEMNVDESDKMQIRHRMINYLCQELSQGVMGTGLIRTGITSKRYGKRHKRNTSNSFRPSAG